ncbi:MULTISPECIES: M56 family metallopeptidase [Chitinophagaceae]
MYWIQHIGPAIVASLWQSALAYLLLYFSRRAHNTRPNQTYILGVGFQWLLVGIFAWNIAAPVPVGLNQNRNFPLSTFIYKTISSSYISYIYIFLLLLNAFIFLLQSIQQKKRYKIYESNPHPIPNNLEQLVTEWKNRLKIKQSIRLVLQENIVSPFTKYLLKPTIVVPLSFVNGLGTKEMEAVLLHELWHIKRHDYLFLIIQLLLEKIMYFNPFFLLIGKAIHEDRELSCDLHAVNLSNLESYDYINTLLFFSKRENTSPSVQLSITGKHSSELVNRTIYLLEKKKNNVFQASISINFIAVIALILNTIYWGTGHNATAFRTPAFQNLTARQPNKAAVLEKETTAAIIPIPETQKETTTNNRNKISKTIGRKEVNTRINTKRAHRQPTSKSSINDEPIVNIQNEDENSAFISMANYIQPTNSNALIFKPLKIHKNKALFVVAAQDVSELEQVFNQTIKNISNHFPIESSTYQYSAFIENSQPIELNTTILKSYNYNFLLTKTNNQILLAIIAIGT